MVEQICNFPKSIHTSSLYGLARSSKDSRILVPVIARKSSIRHQYRETKGRNIVGLPRKIKEASISCRSSLVCKEEVDILVNCRNEFELKESGTANVAIFEDSCRKPSNNSCSIRTDIKHCFPEIGLHYLEERDEGILSRRMLNLSRSNKVRSALELYASMAASGVHPNAHSSNSLLSCLLRNGFLDDALLILEIMREKELVTGHTCTIMLKAVAEHQGCESAIEMFASLEDDDRLVRKFDVIVYNTMISLCAKTKNWVDAEKFWTNLKLNSLTGTKITYELLISTFVQCGQNGLALEAYYEMIQNGLDPSEDVMKAIIASCTKEGDWMTALNVFQKMVKNGMKPNISAFNALINCLGKAGEADLAFKVFDAMKTSGYAPDAYTWNALLSSLYKSNRYADALKLFESIKIDHVSEANSHLYNLALLSCQRLGLWERSLQILWHMETTGMQMSTVSYNHVIHACEHARKPKVALQVYRRMIDRSCTPDTFTYLSLIRACIWGSLWTEIEEILEGVTPNASLYNALIQGFCLRGKNTLAKKLYEKMRCLGLKPDGKTRALMLQRLTNNRQRRHRRYTIFRA